MAIHRAAAKRGGLVKKKGRKNVPGKSSWAARVTSGGLKRKFMGRT